MKRPKLSERTRHLVQAAGRCSRELGHSYVGTEHLLLALSAEPGAAGEVLRAEGVIDAGVRALVLLRAGRGSRDAVLPQGLTEKACLAMRRAAEEARGLKAGDILPEHLLLALLRDEASAAGEVLFQSGAEPDLIFTEVYRALRAQTNAQQRKGQDVRLLEQYCENMLEKAQTMQPVIGREQELCELMQVLSRKHKNNPALIGEPGVGKTAIAEALAQKLAAGQVPQALQGKKLYRLDMAGILAGTKYRGEFEERIRDLLLEIRRCGNMILFLDEMHTIVGAGSAEGAIDAANLLKPALGRGEVQIIGATTLEEYRKYIEKDAALERRFRPITVKEPSRAQTREILRGLRPGLEEHHRVKILDEAIDAAVELSCRYLAGRFLPDKAIDLLDEAAAGCALEGGGETARAGRRAISQKLEQAVRDGAYEQAAKFRDELQRISRREASREGKSFCVGREQIAKLIARQTGIPAESLNETEKDRLLELERTLGARVVGQQEAVREVCRAVRRGRSGMADAARPAAAMLFAGPSGVGKTELCKALAECVYGGHEALVRIDMSEYMEKSSLSRLIGAPPGYVGHGEPGLLAEKVRRRPYCVVLLDEIEKAHPDVRNLLLQVMDDGILTDAMGRTVSFQNALIVMTSNAGSEGEGKGALGFGAQQESARTWRALRQVFSPEFLGRVDCVAVFARLGLPELTAIAEKELAKLCARARAQNITLQIDPEVPGALAALCGLDEAAARGIRHHIQRLVESPLAEALLSGAPGRTWLIGARDGEVFVAAAEGEAMQDEKLEHSFKN